MKVLSDTSVLVAAVVRAHPMHRRAQPWLHKAAGGELSLYVASHSLAEMYSVLTTLPVRPRIGPATAWRLIHENIENIFKVVSLSGTEYKKTIRRVAELALAGGIVYDALIAAAAQKAGVDVLLTFNPEGFRRVWPEGEKILLVP